MRVRPRRCPRIDPEKKIKGVDIHLKGFNMAELKDIIGYIRSVEAHRESRVVLVNLDTPDDNVGEALRRIWDLWPEEEGPRFTFVAHKVEERLDQE